MKIAYVTTYDATDIKQWSGLGYYISHALREQAITVEHIGSLPERFRWLTQLKKAAYRWVLHKQYLADRDMLVVKHYSRHVARRMSGASYDAILSPGTLPIAFLESKTPIVFWTDAIFASMVNFYPAFTNLNQTTIANGMSIEQAALDRARLAIFSSDWAAQAALTVHRADPAKVKVVPFGANIQSQRTFEEVKAIIQGRSRQRCQLLFLAVDWIRKGGDQALAVAKYLNEQGLPTDLVVVGCTPPASVHLPPYVQAHGYISKSTSKGREKIDAFLKSSHFLILPALADCTPIVLPEANSFGVPCLCTNVGGIPTIIKNGINGCTFSIAADASQFGGFIAQCWNRYEDYCALALSSFNEYCTHLNWAVAGQRVKQLLQGL